MRYLLILFLFLGCTHKKLTPVWYNQSNSLKDQVLGYAEAPTCKEAKTLAREDIAKQLHVEIDSLFNLDETAHTKQIHLSINETLSRMTLHDIKLVSSETIDNRCYVKLSYCTKPLSIKASIEAQKSHVEKMKKDNLLYHTLFSKMLKKSLGYIPRYYVSFGTNPMLHIGSESFSISQYELTTFLFEVESPFVNLAIEPKQNLHVKELYKLEINSIADGYISVIYIDEFFTSQIVIKNHYIYSNHILELPARENYIQANISSNMLKIKEMYLVLFCDNIVDLSTFEKLDSTLQVDSNALKFSELIPLVTGCQVESKIITVENY